MNKAMIPFYKRIAEVARDVTGDELEAAGWVREDATAVPPMMTQHIIEVYEHLVWRTPDFDTPRLGTAVLIIIDGDLFLAIYERKADGGVYGFSVLDKFYNCETVDYWRPLPGLPE